MPENKRKVALITGITGQDGAYLAEFLLARGYDVHGIKRRSSSLNTARIDHIYQDPHVADRRLFLHYGDMSDGGNLTRLIQTIQPDEIYNLAAQSHVRVSFDMPEYTTDINAGGTLRLLEAIRLLGLQEKTRFYQASTSEIFGNATTHSQNEDTPFRPCSPYAVSKLHAFWTTVNYREGYGMHASNGILFNHESPLRGETFVSRKITRAVARRHHGSDEILYLGNLDALRDWGHARDYVEAMWRMLQRDRADDYVIATGVSTSVRQLAVHAFARIGVDIVWHGSGLDEIGVDARDGRIVIAIDAQYFRPNELYHLLGDPSKARRCLSWQADTDIEALIAEMVAADIRLLSPQRAGVA